MFLFTQWNYWMAIIAMSGVKGAQNNCKHLHLLIFTPSERPSLHLLVSHDPMQVHSIREKLWYFIKFLVIDIFLGDEV